MPPPASNPLTLLALAVNGRLDLLDIVMFVNPLIATLKPQRNGPSYSNTVIGTLAVDG